MAAPALYGEGTRWRRPVWEEARDGGAQRCWRPAPPPPRLPSSPPAAVPEERSWAGFSRVPWMALASRSPGPSRRPGSVGEVGCSRGELGPCPC